MKVKIKLIPFLLLAFIMLAANCCEKEDEQELPEITQTGEDSFGCLVNGDVWLPKGRILYNSKCYIEHEPYMDIVYIDIYASYEGRRGFRFSIPKDFMNLGKNTIKKEIGRGSGIRYHIKGKAHYFTEESAGELMITSLDTITNDVNVTPYRITAGTFWFDLFNEDGEKIEIRNGRFDLRDYSGIYNN